MSDIPKRYTRWNVTTLPDDFEHRDLFLRFGENIVDRIRRGSGLYVHGRVGNGKTTAACAVAMTYIVAQTHVDITRGRSSPQLVQFVNVPTLLDSIKRGFADDEQRARSDSMVQTLSSVPLVVFDDIGAERPSEWVRERLLTIVGARYESELTTIFTSNLTLAELSEPLGARLPSRIAEMTVPIPFNGPDRRQKI